MNPIEMILKLEDVIKITECCKLCRFIANPIDQYPCVICTTNPLCNDYFCREKLEEEE